jgi:hypothetical protein
LPKPAKGELTWTGEPHALAEAKSAAPRARGTGNGAPDGWPVTVCREFAGHAVPMLEAASLRMRQRLAEGAAT